MTQAGSEGEAVREEERSEEQRQLELLHSIQ